MTGRLYGIGLGPGDPELMTLKADRLIRAAQVVAYPAPEGGESFARSIARHAIPETSLEVPIRIPMREARFPAQSVYDTAAATLRAHLQAGRDVVVLCEGDPFFYGSFMYLYDRLSDCRAEVVPGVTSLTACAAASARPLCARNEVLTIIPGPLDDTALEARLADTGAAAILKVGRHLPRLRRLLTRLDLAARAAYVSHATLPHARHLPLSDAPDDAPYFSMILIPGTDPYVTS